MKGLGERLRARAKELGWSDAEVARNVGLGQTRYAGYVLDQHEPDYETLLRICSTLGLSVGTALGEGVSASGAAARLRARVAAASEALDEPSLEVLSVVVDGLVARSRGSIRKVAKEVVPRVGRADRRRASKGA